MYENISSGFTDVFDYLKEKIIGKQITIFEKKNIPSPSKKDIFSEHLDLEPVEIDYVKESNPLNIKEYFGNYLDYTKIDLKGLNRIKNEFPPDTPFEEFEFEINKREPFKNPEFSRQMLEKLNIAPTDENVLMFKRALALMILAGIPITIAGIGTVIGFIIHSEHYKNQKQ